jgi:hypothetical protein
MPLTNTVIRKAKTQDETYRLSDGGSLYLWVTPAGGKLWRWAYRHEGKEKLMSFGKYPEVSLALARERHSEARKLLATGLDPMALLKAAKAAEKAAIENSFQSIASRWLEQWEDGKSPRHVESVRGLAYAICSLLSATATPQVRPLIPPIGKCLCAWRRRGQ